MTTIFYSIVPHNSHIIMYNPDCWDKQHAPRTTFIGWSLRNAKARYKAYLGITTRVHWDNLSE